MVIIQNGITVDKIIINGGKRLQFYEIKLLVAFSYPTATECYDYSVILDESVRKTISVYSKIVILIITLRSINNIKEHA